jgi:Fanconi anemia group J protein
MGITDFFRPVDAQFDGGESEGAQISPSPQTLEAVPVPDASGSDPNPSPPQDAREAWRPEREAREAFGTLGGAPPSDVSRRRARGAAHDLQYDEWAQPKRGRNFVLREFREKTRGAGAPMAGCVVHFPAGLTPHVPQKITMSRILTALTKSQNALIESPTGTGKSLALLCSALAWQETKKAEVRVANERVAERNAAKTLAFEEACARRRHARAKEAKEKDTSVIVGTIGRSRGAPASDDGAGARADAALARELDETLAEHEKEKQKAFSFSFSNDENEPLGARARDEKVSFTLGRPDGLVVPKLADPDDDVSVHVIKNEPDSDSVPERKPFASEFAPIAPPALERPQSVPKIYLCSRTHSQLHQLMRELKRTPYAPRYAVLGSRKQYCPIGKNDEECTELTKNKNRGETACGWYNKKDAVVEELHRARVWDMEDLDTVAKSHLGCQYYAMRALHKNAELVLCPYNYVFDENIRKALEIDLTGAAVIIDEGHNVEDVCRDGASMEISVTELEDTASQLGSVAKFLDDANVAARLMRPLKDWVNRSLAESSSHASKSSKSSFKRFNGFSGPVEAAHGEALWKGDDVATAIARALAPRTLAGSREKKSGGARGDASAAVALARSIVADASRVTAFDGALVREISQNGNTFGLNAITTCHRVCAALLAALDAPAEFAACVSADLSRAGETDQKTSSTSFGAGDREKEKTEKNAAGLALWCLRPAVSFRPVAAAARCVVVTSGTLSPMGSLEGELGVSFPVKVEAPHVVPSRQIHVEASDVLGDFTAKAQDADGTPRALGQFLLRYLSRNVIPGGVLVFLPKYSLIRRVVERWRDDGTLAAIEKHKTVVWEEPGAQTLTPTLETFRRSIDSGDKKGGVFLAVYRGKVSEGLDFKDANARAVFCVGIPFPAVGDVKVRLKKEYNSSAYARSERMLPGGDWYAHQAFRAYNQALGRCVRHLHDYAAIFLVDARFARHADADRNKSMVSKWMRHLVRVFASPRESVGTLEEFFRGLEADPPGGEGAGGEPAGG